jgi:hypothetical protein
VQVGQAIHAAQYVLVELFFVQICTPGPPLNEQSRTSCSMHGQAAEMFNFHAHSRGDVVKHVALLDRAHTGMSTVQLMLLVHATPPQCSAPRGGVPVAWHCVSSRDNGVATSRTRSECLRVRFLGFGMLIQGFTFKSRAQRNPANESTASGTDEVAKETLTRYSSLLK